MSVVLTDIDKELLCCGMHFGVPCRTKCAEVLAEFESLQDRLLDPVPKSDLSISYCASSLSSIAYKYSESRSDVKSCSLKSENGCARKRLKDNSNSIITKLEKGRATVLMDKCEYVQKVMVILNDRSKFVVLGNGKNGDGAVKTENNLWKLLKRMMKSNELSKSQTDYLKPISSVRPRWYGLPKIHKNNVPVRPILSMCRSPQYSISR